MFNFLSTIFVIACFISTSFAGEWCMKHDYSSDVTAANTEASTVAKCSGSFENLVSGRQAPGSSARGIDLLPPWINLTLARQGQKFAVENINLLSGSHISGLIFVLGIPGINEVLFFTNQSETAPKAAKRYGSTIRQIQTWYENALKEGEDDNAALTSLLRVRGLHMAAAKAANERLAEPRPLIASHLYESTKLDDEMWSAFKADLDASNIPAKSRVWPSTYSGRDGTYLPVSQFQQALTQFAFIGFPVLFPKRINLLGVSDEDLIAYNHLWAVLGYAIGIDDKYNVALQPHLKSTREYYQRIFDDYYLPALFNLDFHAKVLMEAQLNGFHEIQDIFTPKTLLMRLLRDIADIPTPNMMKVLSIDDHGKMLQYLTMGLSGFVKKLRESTPSERHHILKDVREKLGLPPPPPPIKKLLDRIRA